MVIAWSSSLSINIIATAPSDNIFVNKSGGGIEGSPMSRHKCTMADALLSLQPKFEKSKVIIWSIYHLFIKAGTLGDFFNPVMGYLSEFITLKKD